MNVFNLCVISFEGFLSKQISEFKKLVTAEGGKVADTLSENVHKFYLNL